MLALVGTAAARWRGARRPARPSLAAPACRSEDAASAPQLPPGLAGIARDRSVVWVILESAGARALPIYGNPRDTAPELSALARDAVVFERAYTAYPESIKGLFSILCSREPPPGTEASDYAVGRIGCVPIAEEMARAGYRTGLFHSGWFVYLGMRAVVEGRGFQELRDAATIASPYRSSFGVDDRLDGGCRARVRRFAAARSAVLRGVHADRRPPSLSRAGRGAAAVPRDDATPTPTPTTSTSPTRRSAGYARACARAGWTIAWSTWWSAITARRSASIRRTSRMRCSSTRRTCACRSSSPRQALWPRRRAGRGARRSSPACSTSRPRRWRWPAVRIPQQYEGQSLVEARPRPARFSTEQGRRWVGLRDGRWKLIVDEDTGRAQLYDLEVDPGERNDSAGARPDVVERYRACVGP